MLRGCGKGLVGELQVQISVWSGYTESINSVVVIAAQNLPKVLGKYQIARTLTMLHMWPM